MRFVMKVSMSFPYN